MRLVELIFDIVVCTVLCFDAIHATRGNILRGSLELALAATPLAQAGTNSALRLPLESYHGKDYADVHSKIRQNECVE